MLSNSANRPDNPDHRKTPVPCYGHAETHAQARQADKSVVSWHQESNNFNGWRTFKPLKRLKPLSVITHSQFHSIAKAA